MHRGCCCMKSITAGGCKVRQPTRPHLVLTNMSAILLVSEAVSASMAMIERQLLLRYCRNKCETVKVSYNAKDAELPLSENIIQQASYKHDLRAVMHISPRYAFSNLGVSRTGA